MPAHSIDSTGTPVRHALPPQDISTEVLLEKYAKDQETSIDDLNERVARALAQAELPNQRVFWQPRFAEALRAGFVPAGRIQSAAGTGLSATLCSRASAAR